MSFSSLHDLPFFHKFSFLTPPQFSSHSIFLKSYHSIIFPNLLFLIYHSLDDLISCVPSPLTFAVCCVRGPHAATGAPAAAPPLQEPLDAPPLAGTPEDQHATRDHTKVTQLFFRAFPPQVHLQEHPSGIEVFIGWLY